MIFNTHRVSAAALAALCAGGLLVSGCAGNRNRERVVYQERPVELLFSGGARRLDQRRWDDAVAYFEEVERQHPYSEWSRRAILMTLYARYQSGDYADAIAAADRFIQLYPGNPQTPYAYYMRAVSYYEQITDVGRDQAATAQAQAALREVISRYPTTEYAADSRLKLDTSNDQLAGKEMAVGRYYLRQSQPLAAIGRFKTVVDRYQTTTHTPEALYRLVEAYLSLGLTEEARRNAAVLGHNYAGDQWYADAYALMTDRGLQPATAPRARRFGLFRRGSQEAARPAAALAAPPPRSPTRSSRSSAAPVLIGLSIRDVVLIEQLDLAIGPGLTALTGETGAGKSIVLDALGLATGRRAEAGLVRRGAPQAVATASFAPPPAHPVWALLDERGLPGDPSEDLVLRRQVSADGRSRAFVNDQPVGVGVLRDLGAELLEVHGQHETVGLLDARTHRALLDDYAESGALLAAAGEAWAAARAARERADALGVSAARAAAEAEALSEQLGELDRLDPRQGEEAGLAEERALLGAAEKTLADIASAREAMGSGGVAQRLAQGLRALERARERAVAAGAAPDGPPAGRLGEAAEALERALLEAEEASAAIDRAAESFLFEPDRLEAAETRLFALRGAARKLGVGVEDLPRLRAETAQALRALESSDETLRDAVAEAGRAETAYREAAAALSARRREAAERLAAAVERELKPLKLERARFRAVMEPVGAERAGPGGADRVAFEISTNPGAPFGPLESIASGGELARIALALKVVLAGRGAAGAPVMIFDEVDQGVGGAVADAVGARLKRLAESAQVLVVTHSPQVAARAEAHWRVTKRASGERVATALETLTPAAREEEIARMLAGAEVTDAARAAARALIAA